ncbi:phasin family protein [Seohaeicola zhoushanensis]|uniref:Phasin domain-containing protein n=1 Tax=Seohaeicola zhoushanensis TaxID=1569283 RepID=A0A8J3GYI9_9RHOB|nr:phasin family protein [Seohaeicola zhoushanensis]GHF52585.1 hypothetical protein GCM10017056_25190 [Seohaeicola zhoushanensis]
MNKIAKETQAEAKVSAADIAQNSYERMAEMELALIRPMSNFGVAMADAWADLIAESASFIAQRLRQDARTQHAILHCRSASDLHEIHASFFQKAIDDYQDEAARMSSILERSARAMTETKET